MSCGTASPTSVEPSLPKVVLPICCSRSLIVRVERSGRTPCRERPVPGNDGQIRPPKIGVKRFYISSLEDKTTQVMQQSSANTSAARTRAEGVRHSIPNTFFILRGGCVMLVEGQ